MGEAIFIKHSSNSPKKGDIICITGEMGESQAGLEYLKKHGRKNLTLTRKHLRPLPCIHEARVLVKNLKINSMIDISDGLSSELSHLTEENDLGAVIYEEQIPISFKCMKLAALLNRSPLAWALSSGEEYELLFSVDKKDKTKLDRVKKMVTFSVIGEMVDKRQGVKLIQTSGKVKELNKTGFVHF